MKMDLRSPCADCPYRTDKPGYLTKGRVRELKRALIDEQATFSCHKTDRGKGADPQHCAGALILLEKLGKPNQWMRIAERLGIYDHYKLNMDAPIFDSFEDMIKAQPR